MKKLDLLKTRLSVAFKTILFPIKFEEFFEAIIIAGYTPIRRLPSLPIGTTASVGGEVAVKGNCSIDINMDKGFIGVQNKEPDKVLETFNEVLSILNTPLGVRLEETVKYYELVAEGTLITNKEAIRTIQMLFEKNKLIIQLNRIINEPVGVFALRLTPIGKKPNQEEWFDIKIEPDILKPDIRYYSYINYRSGSFEKIKSFTEKLEKTIQSIITQIESQSEEI